jgi:transposase
MSASNVRYVGLDVHKRVVQACFLAADGRVIEQLRFDLGPHRLQIFAEEHLLPTDRLALEATTNTWAVARILKPHVAQLVVSNPLTTRAIAAAKVKTDKVDARVLAHLLRCDYLPPVWQPDEATQELRRLTSARAGLVADRTRIKNRLHAVLAQRLILLPGEDLFTSAGLQQLAELPLDEEGRLLVDMDLRLLEAVSKELARLDAVLARKAWQEERVKLLMTLPGVDVAVAQALLAALGDITRFRDGDHAASYLGLVPSTRQSANKCYHGPITKTGRSHARWMLVQAAQHVARHPGPLGAFFRRLAKKKNHNVAVVAAARKLVTIAWQMLTHNEPYRYAQPRRTQDKLAKLRVRATGGRRKTGPRQGAKCLAKLPGVAGGSRTIKPLARVYQEENLPPLAEPRPGERRMLQAQGLTGFAASLSSEHIVPRRQTKPQTAKP